MSKDWRLLYKDSGSKYASQCFLLHVIAKMHEDIILSHQWHHMAGPFIHPVLQYVRKNFLTSRVQQDFFKSLTARLSSIWVNSFHSPEHTPKNLAICSFAKTPEPYVFLPEEKQYLTNVEFFQVSRLAGPHTQWGPWPNLRPQLNQSRCEGENSATFSRCSYTGLPNKKFVFNMNAFLRSYHIHWLYYSIHIQCMCILYTYWNIPSGNMLSVISHLFSTYKSTQVLFSFVWKYIYAFTCSAMMDLLRDLDLAASDSVGRSNSGIL